ncbi:MAG: ribonuclease P protein component [Muribaculaceae bacterium]|nr:ribonuclease P protein component [Muribaculaceae bacterium]
MQPEIKESYRFPKAERLHHRSLVEGLFRLGKSFYEFPFKVTWRKLSQAELEANFRNKLPADIGSLQMMVTVPKKKRHKATDRVLMRRRIREAYRLHRIPLRKELETETSHGTLSLALVYVHDKNLPYAMIEQKMIQLLDKLYARTTSQEK